MVEFAIVLPLLLLLFVISMDFAATLLLHPGGQRLPRAGALYAGNPDLADNSPYESVEQAVTEAAQDLDEPPVIVVSQGVDSTGERCVSVTVSYTGRMTTHFPGIPSTYNISRTAFARLYPAALAEDQP